MSDSFNIKNVILFVVDSLRYDRIGYITGNKKISPTGSSSLRNRVVKLVYKSLLKSQCRVLIWEKLGTKIVPTYGFFEVRFLRAQEIFVFSEYSVGN